MLELAPEVLASQAAAQHPRLLLAEDLHRTLARLLQVEGPWSEEVQGLDPLPAVRVLFQRVNRGTRGAVFDFEHVGTLIRAGRLAQADATLARSLAVFSEASLSRADLLLLRADVGRITERWTLAEASLAEAHRTLTEVGEHDGELYALDVRCRYFGVLSQLELTLGRPDQAWAALLEEQRVVDLFRARASSFWVALAEDAARNSLYRRMDFLLLVARYEAVVGELDGSAEAASPDLRVLLGMALAELELEDPTREPRARAILLELHELPDLQQTLRVAANFKLAQLDLARGRTEAHRARLDAIDQSLDRSGGDPTRDSAIRNVAYRSTLESWHARVERRPRAELELRREELDQALDLLLVSWARAPLVAGGIGYLQDDLRKQTLGELIELCRVLGDLEHALPYVLEFQAMGSLGRSLEVEVPSLADVQSELVEDGGILIFVPTSLRTHLLLLDRTGLAYVQLAGERELRGRVAELEFQLALGEGAEGIARASSELGEALLPEAVRARIESWSHVYVVGSNLLDDPVFEALPFGASTLGRERALAYLPSIPLGVHLARRARPVDPGREPTTDLFLLAGPPPGEAARERWPELLDIPLGAEDWERLMAPFEPGRTVSLIGTAASRRALLEADLSSTRMLHVFGHGAHDAARVLPPCLVLAETPGEDDGLLWSEDVERLRVPELVVLSACGAARGKRRHGEDAVQHLGGAFLRAGATTVVLARSDLEARATLRLMEAFHRQLRRGASVAEALRAARAEEPAASSHGAARIFCLGPSHRPLYSVPDHRERPWLALALGALATSVAAGFLVLRRRSA